MKRLVLASLAGLALFAFTASVAEAAAPRIVIVSGKPLAHQVVISDWQPIFIVVHELANARAVARSELADRPWLKLSMFWGPRWNEYLNEGKSPAASRPRDADQHGRFYPAWRGRQAIVDLPWAGRWPRLVSPRARTTLKRYGVPVAV
jgi:hypothetical protein